MTFRERLKKFKEKSRLVVSSNLPPTPNDQTPSPNLNPTSTSLSTPNAPGPSGHGSAPQSGGQTTADNGWASLKGLLEILGNGASASGPLKIIIDDLFRCLCLHEVCTSVRTRFRPRLYDLWSPRTLQRCDETTRPSKYNSTRCSMT